MTIGEAPDCMGCKWFNSDTSDGFNCDAFPEGIPEVIMMGKKHTEVWDWQEGEFIYKKFDPERDLAPPREDE